MKDENILIIDVDDNTTSLLSDLMGRLDCKFSIVPDPGTALTHLKDEHATLVMAEVSLFQTEPHETAGNAVGALVYLTIRKRHAFNDIERVLGVSLCPFRKKRATSPVITHTLPLLSYY